MRVPKIRFNLPRQQNRITGATTSGASAEILTASAAAHMLGKVVWIFSGTNFVKGAYTVVAVDPGTSLTVDRNATIGNGANGVFIVGMGKALDMGRSKRRGISL